MFAYQHQTTEIPQADRIAAHRCVNCLTGSDPRKRDCAIRTLLADGLTADGVAAFRTVSLHTR